MTILPLTAPLEAESAPAVRQARALRDLSGVWPRLAAAALAVASAGCVSVKAPDKPIVIELNVNIRQEVVYRLAPDAGRTIQSNPDIF